MYRQAVRSTVRPPTLAIRDLFVTQIQKLHFAIMSECHIFIKTLSGSILEIPILSTDDLQREFIIEGLQYCYEEYQKYSKSQLYLFPLEHDEKEIALDCWKPEPDETIGLFVIDEIPTLFISYEGLSIHECNNDKWYKWKLSINHQNENLQFFCFYSSPYHDCFFHESCLKLRTMNEARDEIICMKDKEDYDINSIPSNSSIYNKTWTFKCPGSFECIEHLILSADSDLSLQMRMLVADHIENEWDSALKWLEEYEDQYDDRID